MILCADVLEGLAALPDASFDACLTDPPYGIRFMGRKWDHGVPSTAVWAEVLRVLKPGAFLFAFGGTRSFHRLACAIEDAGFEIRDSVGIAWGYGSGFPKSLDIGKAIDKAAGAEREVVGVRELTRRNRPENLASRDGLGRMCGKGAVRTREEAAAITAPATPAARTWEGYGTALAPSWEPVVVAMKPLAGTFARNVLQWGIGGINIDGGRIGTAANCIGEGGEGIGRQKDGGGESPTARCTCAARVAGRWPKNAVLVHDARCRRVGTRRVRSDGHHPAKRGRGGIGVDGHGGQAGFEERSGPEVVEAWECVAECLVAALDAQAGELSSGLMKAGTQRSQGGGYQGNFPGQATAHDTPGDSGPASRFFFQAGWHDVDFWPLRYVAKASTEERERGLRGVLPCVVCGDVSSTTHRDDHGREQSCRRCDHPTIKPLELTKYLATLLLPPRRESAQRRLLVPFSGAGSEMIGATLAKWEQVVGIDSSPWYCRLAQARIAAADWRTILERPLELAPITGSLFPSEPQEPPPGAPESVDDGSGEGVDP